MRVRARRCAAGAVARQCRRQGPPQGLDRATVDLVCALLADISERLAVAYLVCVDLAIALEARGGDRDCVRSLRAFVCEPLHTQLNLLRNLAREIPRSLDRVLRTAVPGTAMTGSIRVGAAHEE